jgi:hypothetical protein
MDALLHALKLFEELCVGRLRGRNSGTSIVGPS